MKTEKNTAVNTEKDYYIGEAINQADNNKVDPELVKERTATLNENPRDNSLDE